MNMGPMDHTEIIKYIPHRSPFLLIDRVLELVPDQSIVAIKNITINEPFFQGHFPGQPVMPGVLMLEALAQACGVLAYQSAKKDITGYLYYFAGIDNARFKRIVTPGDQLRLEVDLIKIKGDYVKATGRATVDGELACSADLVSVGRGQNDD